MKINWDRWIIRDRRRLLFGGYLACISSIIFLIIKFEEPRVKDKNDLNFISGQFRNYDFVDGSKGYHNYTFTLLNYSNSFKIKADFLNFFDQKNFKKLNYGDTIDLSISREDVYKLNTNNYIMIFSLSSSNTNFLNLTESIKEDNSYLIFYLTVFWFLFGLGIIYLGYKSSNTTSRF